MKSLRSKVMGRRQKDLLNDVSESHPGSNAASEADSNSVRGEDGETPDAAVSRLITTFCKSLAAEGPDVALLPSIVEAAESSPATAAECARRIRKHLYKENWQQPTTVYNAIMLMRILVENPGNTFTRSLDKKFVEATRDVLRHCPHMQVVHFLIEALQEFEAKLPMDDGLARIVEMWQKEKSKSRAAYPTRAPTQPIQPVPPVPPVPPMQSVQPPTMPMQPMPGYGQLAWQNGNGGGHHYGSNSNTSLPRPKEVRKRLEEARTTASVLADLVNTSTPEALLDHDLMGDLSSRCRRASVQILDFLNAQRPSPDNFEIQQLLDAHQAVHESLQHYYRAVLDARKRLNVGETRRSETTGAVSLEMTSANKGKGAAPESPSPSGPVSPDGPLMSGASNGYSHSHDDGERSRSNGKSVERAISRDHTTDRRDEPEEDLYSADDDDYGSGSGSGSGRDRNRDVDRAMQQDMAAAIAASKAPGASSRPLHRYDPSPEDPFADGAAGSSRGPASGAYGSAYDGDVVSPLEEDSRASGKGAAAVYRY